MLLDPLMSMINDCRSQILNNIRYVLLTTFLPIGYPDSVRPEYLEYQAWDCIQGTSSYLRSVLTTKSLLQGAGVGSAEVWRLFLSREIRIIYEVYSHVHILISTSLSGYPNSCSANMGLQRWHRNDWQPNICIHIQRLLRNVHQGVAAIGGRVQ